MDNSYLAKTLNELLVNKIKKEEVHNPLTERAAIVKKIIFDVYASWDHCPKNLDTDSFTEQEALIALSDLQNHEEIDMGTGLQYDNAISQILAVRDLIEILSRNIKRVPEKVVYV